MDRADWGAQDWKQSWGWRCHSTGCSMVAESRGRFRKLEALPEGTGIMLDDVAAGVVALAVGLVLAHWV